MATPRRIVVLVLALLLLPFAVATTSTASASSRPTARPAADGDLFRTIEGFRLGRSDDVRVRPKAYTASSVDLPGLREQLSSGPVTLSVPDPGGRTVAFDVVEDSVMEPELQAAHPEIRTYAGAAADGSSIRLDVTPMGFHAMVRRPDGRAWYVDPAYQRRGEDRVLSYAGSAVPRAPEAFVERELEAAVEELPEPDEQGFSTPGGIVSQRTYRLAFLTEQTYAQEFGTAFVFAEKTTLINRVNEVYNDDLAIRFEMVAGTDTVLNLDTDAKAIQPDGPCGASACFTPDELASCSGSTLDRNEFVLGQLIGAQNFDIGHIGLGVNGGGIAGLGVVGGAFKADGCTGLPTPTGDFYAIDYVAHEIGHQMGGNHTFNGTQGNCSAGNRNVDPFTTQVEPGSGSSIMAYAGICQSDNLQPHSDPYFSFASIDEINATTAAAPGSVDERQVVSFSGLDAGETFTLSCASCPTSSAISITGNPLTDLPAIATAVSTATGVTVTPTPLEVSGYDGAASPSTAGFTVDFAVAGAGTDIKTLTVQPVSGTFSAFTGVTYDGGPETNQGTVAATTNHAPVVTAPADKTIPMRTPFTLTGSGTDSDADTLTYLWEQTDAGGLSGTGLVSNTKTDGPLFRQFGEAAQVSATDTLIYHSPGENLAGTSPTRTFPDLAQILAGNTNAASGTCPAPAAGGTVPVTDPALNCFSEFLPTGDWVGNPLTPRVMHFRLTGRDEFTPDGAADDPGGVSWDDLALTVDPAAGPFLVTSRATAGSPASGFEKVTWDVAGTNTAALAQNVKISLSTDGGLTYPTVLAASTPNDGSHIVTLPNVTTSTARIMVEAVDNYFFDVNDANFSITPVVGNLAPVVDAGPDASVVVGAPFSSSGTFADETPATATATVDYGDGAGAEPLTLTGSTFDLTHTYTSTGVKTVTVTVTDDGSLSGSDTAQVTVTSAPPPQPPTPPTPPAVVHLGDGKGRFTSKETSSKLDPDATGRSTFAFTADARGTTPSGSASFKFKRGKIAFAGTTVTSASTSGRTLTMTVTGTNRMKAGYTLVIVAKDRGAKDKIRVRLLKGSKVVYDSMRGKPASAPPRTKIKGQITVT